MNTSNNKYPNADTSSERLAEIEKFHLAEVPGNEYSFKEVIAKSSFVRDLLAMLQERGPPDAELTLELKIEGGAVRYDPQTREYKDVPND